MSISPSHFSHDKWISDRWDEIARLSHDSGVTVQETQEASELHLKLGDALGQREAQIIPFPRRLHHA